jgi:inhibitor of KinA
MKQPEVKSFGEKAVLLQWEQLISIEVHQQVLAWQNHLENQFSALISEVIPAYNSLLVILKDNNYKYLFLNELKKINISSYNPISASVLFYVPVCYEAPFSPDLEVVARKNNLTIDEAVRLHSANIYTVYFTGFLPGFPYLGDLDKRLHTPRMETPRPQIPKGAVAIGGSQTGIYSTDSPGGWNIIGRSPLTFFNMHNRQPSLFKAGDKIKFEIIDTQEYNVLSDSIEKGNYKVKMERLC